MANKNCIEHRFNIENEMAGIDWLRGFRNIYIIVSLLELRNKHQVIYFNIYIYSIVFDYVI